jgi:hypothetical protein
MGRPRLLPAIGAHLFPILDRLAVLPRLVAVERTFRCQVLDTLKVRVFFADLDVKVERLLDGLWKLVAVDPPVAFSGGAVRR